ncbi:MAG: S1C family serine protease [Verrucomicrobiae bacterium]
MLPRAASNFLAAALAAFAISCGAGSVLRAEDPAGGDLSAQVRKIFDERRNAVVKVRATDKLGIRFGSGFFADPTGMVYTHAGIVLRADEVSVLLSGGKELPAQVLVADERSGIAILKVDASTPSIPIGDSPKVTMGTPLILIGYPEALEVRGDIGIVAGFDRKLLDQYFSTTHIRANLPVQRGEGGAPVLNLQGEAIGILVGRIDGGASCHVLPIRAAEKVRSDFARFGALRPGWVGVEVEDVAEPTGGSTAKVAVLDPETPAAKSGLKSGDVLLKVGGTPITSSEDVIDASYFLTAGENAEIEVLRGTEKLSIGVRPILHPRAGGHEMQATALPDDRIHLD